MSPQAVPPLSGSGYGAVIHSFVTGSHGLNSPDEGKAWKILGRSLHRIHTGAFCPHDSNPIWLPTQYMHATRTEHPLLPCRPRVGLAWRAFHGRMAMYTNPGRTGCIITPFCLYPARLLFVHKLLTKILSEKSEKGVDKSDGKWYIYSMI